MISQWVVVLQRKRTKPTAKRRRTSPKRRPRKVPPWWAVGALLLVLLALSVWLVSTHLSREVPVPAYEEANPNGFSTLVGEVELSVYQSLRQLGVSASQVQFRKVVHQSQEERHWDYAELEALLLQGQDFVTAEQVIVRNLAALPGDLSWVINKETDSNLEIRIVVEGILTHLLTLHRPQAKQPTKSVAAPSVQVAIVIDDLGYDGRLARRFLKIQVPLSFSVLPYGTFSKHIARLVHEAGRELLLHLPMEPKDYPEVNPGDGALLVGMSDEVLLQKLRENLDVLPFIVGVNNHMGSRFCEYEEKMRLVIGELKRRGLFFLDSRTSRRSKGYRVAVQVGIPAAERNVFLDNIQTPQAIQSQLQRLFQLARLRGSAIGIAHPQEVTLEVLRQVLPQLQQQGIELVTVSQLLHG